MTIQQCKYVVAIAKAGSFSEASKQLFVAQSALSSSVKQLERELGIKIFERSKNGVYLSLEGAEFVRSAEQLTAHNDLIRYIYSERGERSRLYVATQHYDFVADIFCSLLSTTKEEKYDFSLREIQTYEVIREVAGAYSDIGIIAIKDSDTEVMTRYLQKKGVEFCRLLTTSPHVFVRAGHPLSGKSSLGYDELVEYTYLSYEQGQHNSSFFTEELITDFKGEKCVSISDRATLMNVLLTTDCFTVGTGIMPSALNSGKIVSLPLLTDAYYSIGYILRRGAERSALCERFISLLEDFGREHTALSETK